MTWVNGFVCAGVAGDAGVAGGCWGLLGVAGVRIIVDRV